MQDQRPDIRPRPLPSVSLLARTHGHRALRIAGVTALVVALLAGVGGLIHLLGREPTQAVTPANVDRLMPAWTADLGPGAMGGIATTSDGLFVSGADGLASYPLPCTVTAARTCAPTWQARVPDGPLSAPTTNGDLVYAGSADGHLYAFPAHCDAECRPQWNAAAGEGVVSAPGLNDDFVYVASGKLYAFPARCGTDDRTCRPAWVADIPGHGVTGRPAVGGGLVVVASGGPRSGVTAFPAVCIDPCKPVWSAETGGPATSVTLSHDTAYVVARGLLIAYPMSCTGTCRPAWTATAVPGHPFARGALGPPTLSGGQLYVGTSDGRLLAFPEGCGASVCAPTRSWLLGDAPLLAPLVQDQVIYAASTGGVLDAIPLGCDAASPGCGDPWSVTLGADAAPAPAATPDGLYVGDVHGVVHAFTVPSAG